MKLRHSIFGMTALMLGLCGCSEVKEVKNENTDSDLTPTATTINTKNIDKPSLKLAIATEPTLKTPVAEIIKDKKTEEQQMEQVKEDTEERVLYEAKLIEYVEPEPIPEPIIEEGIQPEQPPMEEIIVSEPEPIYVPPVEEVVIPVQPEIPVETPSIEETPPVEEISTPEPIVDIGVQPEQPEPVIDEGIQFEQPPVEEVIASEPEPVQEATLSDRIAQEAINLAGNTEGMQCTEVVSQAMTNAGMENVQVLWPDEYFIYGEYTDNPVAGDLIYYDNGGRGDDHIAIYIGDGQAVHGNYNGSMEEASNSAIASADLGIPSQYIHVYQ